MKFKKILLLAPSENPWGHFLRDYFSDVLGALETVQDPVQAAASFDKISPTVLFLDGSFCSKTLHSKIKVRKHTDPFFRVYLLGEDPTSPKEPLFDGIFPAAPELSLFSKRFVDSLPLPETVRILVVDDEKEIGSMVRDYFEGRKHPSFEVAHAPNGREALTMILRQEPNVIILDIKMPVMDGREFYAKLKEQGSNVPVIVFFDSISGEELEEIRKFGNPAVVEKGYQGSSLAALMHLVKKLVYFSR